MNQITLKKLRISNFMGCRSFEADFEDETTISGDNATGKSTIYDAFLWCLFGKNHRDEKDFSIKNTVEKSLNRQDHAVTVVLDVNGKQITLQRIYREKWEKKRGNETQEFSGHETDFFCDDVPLKATEYKNVVDSIIKEDTFKLLTNVYAFNELPWQSARKVLEQIAGTRSDEEIAKGNEDFEKLIRALNGKDFDQYKKVLQARKAQLKESIAEIPIQISEASRSKEDVAVFADQSRLDQIKAEIKSLQEKKDNISLKNKGEHEKINELQQKLSDLKVKLTQAEAKRKSNSGAELIALQSELDGLRATLSSKKRQIDIEVADHEAMIKDIQTLNAQADELRGGYSKINAEQQPEIGEADCNCPTCKQRLPEDSISQSKETLIKNWSDNRIKRLNEINEKGKQIVEKIESIKKRQETSKQVSEALLKESESVLSSIESLEEKIATAKEATQTENKPSAEELMLTAEIYAFVIPESPKADFGDLDQKIEALQKENDSVVASMAKAENNKKADARIEELKQKEIALNKELASVEKTEFVMTEFTAHKMDQVEKSVNEMFKYTTFQLFETQINGGAKEVCVALYGGVPYSGVNYAGRINMGIDIINVLTRHYEVMAPVFIDNCESINKVIPTDCQLIKLQVTTDPKLIINKQSKSINYVN